MQTHSAAKEEYQMKFISFELAGSSSWGAVTDTNQVVDLGKIMGGSLKAIIEAGKLNEARALANIAQSTVELAEVKLLCPIPDPRMILCIGVNYANRNAEYKDGSDVPKFPSLFMRVPQSLTTHMEPLWRPPESDQLDYEGEIVIVIGKRGRRIAEVNAYDHIAGLTIMNEGTLRDWVRHAKFNVTQGKNFCNSGAIGKLMANSGKMTPRPT